MNIVFMSMDTLPSTLWARDLYDQMHIRSDFRKWFPRMCQYGFIEGRDYEYMPRVRLQDEGGRTVQRYVKDYRITQDMAKKLCKLHHTAVGVAYRPQPFDRDALLGLLHKKPPRRSSYEAQLSDSDSLVTTTQIAKEYGCGAKVFNRLLHLHGIQYLANGQWVLYSEHHGKGYTSSLTFRLQRSDGSEVEKLHTAWTQKGRKFLYHTLKRRGVLPLAEQEVKPMNFTDNPFERMMRQRPGTDSGHPCKHCRHKWECGYLLHQCRKKFRSVLGDTAPPAAGAVRP